MQLASAEEVRRVEKGMSWLATTGSVTPFIGLFGTVWGIIDAFSGLGNAGAASLRAVAPGIAEALITTAAGLFVAIPAVIFYNHFLQNIRDLAQRLDTFALGSRSPNRKNFYLRPFFGCGRYDADERKSVDTQSAGPLPERRPTSAMAH